MGFDAWFFARIDYQDKEKRVNESTLEYVWRPMQEDWGSRGEIFTHTLYHHYSAPSGFCFDDRCADMPIVDDPTLEDYNVDSRIAEFHDWVVH